MPLCHALEGIQGKDIIKFKKNHHPGGHSNDKRGVSGSSKNSRKRGYFSQSSTVRA